MRKIVILSILTSSLLFSQDNIEDARQKGIEYFKNSDYLAAIEEFSKINDYKESASVDFYLARSYYELGKFEKALILFERVSINDPENKRVKLEIAQTYLMLESYEIAKVSFLEILEEPALPETVKENIESRLKFIEEKTKKHAFSTSLMFGMGQDDNINSISTEYLKINPDSSQKVKSSFYETALLFNHIYSFNENVSLINGLVFYRQDFTKDQSKQLDVISLNMAPIYKYGDISYGLIFGFDNILYGDNPYLNNYSLTPKISYMIDQTMMYETSIKLLDKKYANDSNENENSLVLEYQNKFTFLTEDFGIFDFGLTFGRENPADKVNKTPYVSKEYGTFSIMNNYKIDEQFSINSSFSYNNIHYKDEVSELVKSYLNLPEEKRVDNVYNFTLGIGYLYSKDLNFIMSYNFVNQDSNYITYDYDKNTLKTTVIYAFQ